MNWNQMTGQWKQLLGKVKKKWGKLRANDQTIIAAKHDQLAGSLQQHYGIAKAQADKDADEFAKTLGIANVSGDRGDLRSESPK